MSLVGALLLLAQTAPDAPVQVVLGAPGQRCSIRADGVAIGEDELESRAAGWARIGRAIELTSGDNTPYRCVGSVYFSLQKAGFRADPEANSTAAVGARMSAEIKLTVLENCEISVNGTAATFAEYDRLAAHWGRNQPEVRLTFHPASKYECVDRTLAVLKRHNVTGLGFVGNEQYGSDTPEDAQ